MADACRTRVTANLTAQPDHASDPPTAAPTSTHHLKRFGVAFALAYLVAYMLPFPLGFPGTEPVAEWISGVKYDVSAFFAKAFGVELPTAVRGSSDSAIAWVQLCVLVTGAALFALGFTALRRRAPEEPRLRSLLFATARYFVASSMLVYGGVKVLKSQFPALQPSDLQTTYGESSPMGLLWRMMGLSTGYAMFTGVLELLGALLLFWRRTTLLGALLLSVALVQVVALNFAFDVPVKLGSMHLLAFTLVLLTPHARRLALFLFGHATQAHAARGLFEGASARVRKSALGAKYAIILFMVGLVSYESHAAWRTWGDGKPAEPLVALYDVTDMQVDGETTCAERWHRVTIDRAGFVVFGALGGKQGFPFQYDAAARSLVVGSGEETLASPAGSVDAHPEAIELEGTLRGKPTTIRLQRVPPEKLLLTSREFRWVTDTSLWR